MDLDLRNPQAEHDTTTVDLPSSPVHITYVGHATTLLEMDGVRILTDPVLRDRIAHLGRHAPPIQPAWHDRVDAVLISHAHWDHLDLPSLRRLSPTTRLIVPAGAGQILRHLGRDRVDELRPGQMTRVGPVEIEATPANHSGFRPPFGPTASQVGFIIRGSRRVYFAGDTDLFPEMADLTQDLTLALLPVWGWGPTLGEGHLNPERAAEALTLLRPRFAMPIHWGTLCPIGMRWTRPKFLVEPPHEFAAHAARLAPEVTVRIVEPGDSLGGSTR